MISLEPITDQSAWETLDQCSIFEVKVEALNAFVHSAYQDLIVSKQTIFLLSGARGTMGLAYRRAVISAFEDVLRNDLASSRIICYQKDYLLSPVHLEFKKQQLDTVLALSKQTSVLSLDVLLE